MTQPSIGGLAKIALTGAISLAVLAELIGDGTFGLMAGVLVFLLCVVAMFSMPMRVSIMALMFLVLTLPNTAEGTPTLWIPPFNNIGTALMNHLNSFTVKREGLLGLFPVSCLEMFFGLLFITHLMRKGSNVPEGRAALSPEPLFKLAYLSLAATALTWMRGLAMGGDFGMSLWQVAAVLYLPVLFLLMHVSLRGPADHVALARVFVWAAIYKSLLAVFVILTAEMPLDPYTGKMRSPDYATSHSDSMLFAVATTIVLTRLLERFDRRAVKLASLVLPILLAGMVANNRRIVWVQIGVVGLIVFALSRTSRFKKHIIRTLVVLVPVIAIYFSAGWESQYGKFYRPVRIVRSIVDSQSDRTGSSSWRDYENINLVSTFRYRPILGAGYGHRYFEIIRMPGVEYSLEFYAPHNSVLGLWAFSGLLGFAGVTMLWVVGNYFAMRAYRHARDPEQRMAAIVCCGALPIYLLQCWGDLGLASWTGVFIMSTSICVSGKLAVALGQWRPAAIRQG